jgi:hypothetical protein
MSALDFDPWATLKRYGQGITPPKAPNPPNPAEDAGGALGVLGGLGGGHTPPAAPEQVADATLAALQAACADRAAALAGAYDAPDVMADREAIAAEEPLPALGTAERERHD